MKSTLNSVIKLRRLRPIRLAWLILPVAAIAFGDIANAAKVKLYRASKVSGQILTRGSNDARWSRVVEGSLLREGQLIQVTDGAKITLDDWVRVEEGHKDGERVQLRLTQPIIARLSHDLLRKVKTTTHFIDKIARSAGASGAPTDEEQLSLNEAWNKVSTIFTGKAPIAPMPDLNQLAKEGMAMGVSAHKIRLLAPATNHVIPTVFWPVELKIVWIAPADKKLRYHVYVWPASKPRGEPTAVTTADYMKLPIKEPGAYMVQIMSSDQAWQSPAHAIHVILAGKGQIAGQDGQPLGGSKDTLEVKYPPDQLSVMTKTSTIDQTFSWSYEAPEGRPTNFILELKDKTKGTKEKIKSSQLYTSLRLGAGTYEWNVRMEGSDIRTPTRTLQILDLHSVASKNERKNLIKTMMKHKGDQSIFFTTDI